MIYLGPLFCRSWPWDQDSWNIGGVYSDPNLSSVFFPEIGIPQKPVADHGWSSFSQKWPFGKEKTHVWTNGPSYSYVFVLQYIFAPGSTKLSGRSWHQELRWAAGRGKFLGFHAVFFWGTNDGPCPNLGYEAIKHIKPEMSSNNSWTQLAKVWKLGISWVFFGASLDGDASQWQMFEAPGGGISFSEAGIKRLYHALSRNGWISSDHYAFLPMFSGKWSVEWFQVKLSYLEWSPPWHTILTISYIVSDISPGSIYGIYIYIFYILTFTLIWHSFWHSIWRLFWLTFCWHIFWQSFWHSLWHAFSCLQSLRFDRIRVHACGSRRAQLHPELTISRNRFGFRLISGAREGSGARLPPELAKGFGRVRRAQLPRVPSLI